MKRYKNHKFKDYFNKDTEQINYYISNDIVYKLEYNKKTTIYTICMHWANNTIYKWLCYTSSANEDFILSQIVDKKLKKITEAEAFMQIV
jgi:hypothetical protein